MNSSARGQLAARGLNTGSFGTWLGRQRVLVRVLLAVLAVIWLFALRPLSVGDIALVLIITLGVAWILELLQRRSDEVSEATAVPPTVEADDQPTQEFALATPVETADAATSATAASAGPKDRPSAKR